MSAAPVARDAEGVASVEVVTVDDHERLVNDLPGHQDCVRGTPRFLPVRAEGKAFRNLVEFLGYEHKLERSAVQTLHVAVFAGYGLLELCKEILPDDVNDLAESGIYRIIDRIVNYRFFVRS